MTFFDKISEDHRTLEMLCDKLIATSPQEIRRREDIFKQIKEILEFHSQVELQVLYPVCETFHPLRELVAEAKANHHTMERILRDLSLREVSGDEWLPIFSVLQESLLDHAEWEEEELFPKARTLVSSHDQLGMIERMVGIRGAMTQGVHH